MKLTTEERERLKALMRDECHYRLRSAVMDRFLDAGTVVELASGSPILLSGSLDTNVYIVIEGILRLWYWRGEREVTNGFAMPGTLFVSYASYYFGEPSFINVETCTPARVLKVSKADYDHMADTDPEFCRWCLSLAQCQIYFYEKKMHLIKGTARERYEALVRYRPEIVRDVKLGIVASYLDVTPQYLSRLRRNL